MGVWLYDGDDWTEHADEAAGLNAAAEAISAYRENAEDGWSMGVESIALYQSRDEDDQGVGLLATSVRCRIVYPDPEDDDEYEEDFFWCDYEMIPTVG